MTKDYKEFPHYVDPLLKKKLRLIAERCTNNTSKLDALLLNDGNEGYGKTTLSVLEAAYLAFLTGRSFSVENIFFDVDKLIDFAKSTKEQIIIWDEAALGGLSTEWWNKSQRNLIKLLMTIRKKRHIFIFNIPKFYKLSPYITQDRAIGLVHVYAQNETRLGCFAYYNKRSLEYLDEQYRRTKKKLYKMAYSFRGTFPNALPKLINEKRYDEMKDEAIESIGSSKTDRHAKKLQILQVKIADLVKKGYFTQKEVCKNLGVAPRTLRSWSQLKIIPQILDD